MEAATLLTGRAICDWRVDADHVSHAFVRARGRGSQKDQRLFQCQPGRADETKGLGVQIKSNSFHLDGQTGERGVRLRSYSIEQNSNPYQQYLWPDPYLPAAIILGLGIVLWAAQVGLTWWELLLLLGPFA